MGSARSLPVPQTDGVVAFPDDGHRAKLVSGTFLHGHNLRSRRIWIESIYFIFEGTSALLSFPPLFPSEVQAASAALAAQPKGVDLEWGTEHDTEIRGVSPVTSRH